MKITVNELPSRTWNRLGMNESVVSLEGEYKSFRPTADYDEKTISWQAEGKGFPSGMHGDLEGVTASAAVGFAKTAAGVQMEKPLVLSYDYEKDSHNVSRLILHAEAGSHMKVVLVFRSPEDSADASALQVEIYGDQNAVVDLYTAQLLGRQSLILTNIAGVCEDNAAVNLTRLELGAGRNYEGANIDLKGTESAFHTKIGYHVKPGQVLDMNYVALHHGKRTTSLMEANGTLEEGARKIFRGTIDFQQGCAGAKGTENENVLLMGDEMVNQTIPLILCKEEDVEGNHGASIGQLDEKVLFYLGTRGISEEAARAIIAQARIEAVCDLFPEESVRNQVREFESVRGISHEAEL